MDGGEEVGCEFVVSGGDAAEVFQTAEHALDSISPAIEHVAERRLEAAVGLRRDVRRGALLVDGLAHRIGVVAAISNQQRVGRQERQQCEGGTAIGGLAAGQREGARPAMFVGQRVEFGGAPAPADADRLRPLPPFPPAAQRCAFIVELSSSSSAGGPPASARA
jgi:hypothetical protein